MKPFTSTQFKDLELLPLHGDLLIRRSHGIKLKEFLGMFNLRQKNLLIGIIICFGSFPGKLWLISYLKWEK